MMSPPILMMVGLAVVRATSTQSHGHHDLLRQSQNPNSPPPLLDNLIRNTIPQRFGRHLTAARALVLYDRLLHTAGLQPDEIVHLILLFILKHITTYRLPDATKPSSLNRIPIQIMNAVADMVVMGNAIRTVLDLALAVHRRRRPARKSVLPHHHLAQDEVVELVSDPGVVLALARGGVHLGLANILGGVNWRELLPLLWLCPSSTPFGAVEMLLHRGQYGLACVLVRDWEFRARILANAQSFIGIVLSTVREGRTELLEAVIRQAFASDIINISDEHDGITLLACTVTQRQWRGITDLLSIENINLRTTDNWGRSPIDSLVRDPAATSKFLDILKAIRPDLIRDALTVLGQYIPPLRYDRNLKMVRMRVDMETAVSALIDGYFSPSKPQNPHSEGLYDTDMIDDPDEYVFIGELPS